MKKIISFIISILTITALQAQPVTLSFSGQDSNYHWVQLNRITITNVDRNWQETIYYPDTIFVLEKNVGIGNLSENQAEMSVNIIPNPFDGHAEVIFDTPEEGAVTLEICDIAGKSVVALSLASIDKGSNVFRVMLSKAQAHLLRITQNGAVITAKLINTGNGGRDRIEYLGNYGQRPIHYIKHISQNPYSNGDLMRYVGYADVCNSFLQSNVIETSISGSENFILSFLDGQELAKVSTDVVTNITSKTATCGGNVIDEGCGTVSARGVCWDMLPNPTIADDHTVDGSGLGTFSSSMTGLIPGTLYYVRAYATNDIGTNYGNAVSFTTTACKDSLDETNANICNGAHYIWRGKTYTTTGSYYDSVPKPDGCYIIYKLNLTVNNKYLINEYDTICSGSSLIWHGKTLTANGSYYDSLHTTAGCDSIIRLNLTVAPTFFNVEYDTITAGSSLLWHGMTLTTGGAYYDSLKSTAGCDSIIQLQLTVTPSCNLVTDIDGNTYNVVKIGTQCWMKENLRTTRYADGTYIPTGSTTSLSVAYKYAPDNDVATVNTYGYLYNWRAVMGKSPSSNSDPSGVQGVCPNGWHIPSSAEWTLLENYVNSQTAYQCNLISNNIAKSLASTVSWHSSSNTCAIGNTPSNNNGTGFSALPANYYSGSSQNLDYYAYFWTSTENGAKAYYRQLDYSKSTVTNSSNDKYFGQSVRCVKGSGALLVCSDTLIEERDTIYPGVPYYWHGKHITMAGVHYDSLVTSIGCDSIYKLILFAPVPLDTCGVVSDIDGNTYNTVKIGNQCWMRENLRTTRYANGTAIYMGSTTSSYTGYRYYPGNSAANVPLYGYLYNWRAVMSNSPSSSANPSNVQGICPNGWHVPSDAEWTELINYVSSQPAYHYDNTATNIAKALASNSNWNQYQHGPSYVGDKTYPNNATGFTALPAGYRLSSSSTGFGSNAYFWSATESGNSAMYRSIRYSNEEVSYSSNSKHYGQSVRCVKGAGVLIACNDTVIAKTDTIYPGVPYLWHNKTITMPGIYFDSLTSVNGCDSIYQLTLISGGIPSCGTVTDIDGNTYNTILLDTLCWMRENLRTTRYADGTYIPLSTTTSTSVAYRYYPNNSSSTVNQHGYLYNWRAVMGKSPSSSLVPSGVQGICPNGWHVPSDAEWTMMTNYVSSQPSYWSGNTASYIAKALAASTSFWYQYPFNNQYVVGDTTYKNNSTGFSATPAGYCSSSSASWFRYYAYFWSSTQSGTDYAYYRELSYSSEYVSRSTNSKYYEQSVRCVKGAGALIVCSDTLIKKKDIINSGTTYSWRGRTLTMAGVYFDSLKTANGCDSVYQLTLELGTYPNCGSVTDIDGNTYNTIQIGTQCWMKENLRTTKYADGTLVPLSTNTSSSVAYRYYPNNSSSNVAAHGYLYNWRAVMGNSPSSSSNPSGVQGICPNGWHVPSDAEWTTLTNYVSSQPSYHFSVTASYIGKALAASTSWNVYSYNHYVVGDTTYKNNATGFSATPAGYCLSSSASGFKYYAYFWSSTQSGTDYAYYRELSYSNEYVSRSTNSKYYKQSVRCVKGAGTLIVCSDTLISQTGTINAGSTYSWRGRTLTLAGTYFDSLQTVGGCDSVYQLILSWGSIPNCGTVTDIDNNTYNTVQIGTQCWMRENLRTTKYADNTPIQLGSSTSTTVAYIYYPGNSSSNVATYGYLYNWKAVMNTASSSNSVPSGVQGPCPNGWHVPSDAEWTILTNYVSSQPSYHYSVTATYIAKSLASNANWNNYTSGTIYDVGNPAYPNNATGFSALPAGYFWASSPTGKGQFAYFWSSTESGNSAMRREIEFWDPDVSRSSDSKYYAESIRCLKD